MTDSHEVTLTIENELGLHARAATMFVQVAARYQSEIYIIKDGREVNGKSIMGILTLVATMGSSIQIRATGPDAEAFLKEATKLVKNKFGEER